MKLLFYINMMSGAVGGAERVLSIIASELADRGHEVELATHDPPEAEDFYPLDHRIVRHRLGPMRLRRLSALRALIRARRPDVAIGFMHTAFMPLALATAGTGIRLVASEHTVFAHYRTRPGLPLLLRALAPFFDASTIPSEKARAGYPRGVRGKMVAISNPVAPSNERRSRPCDGPSRAIVAVGNLRKEKGHATLIDAFARTAPDFPEWTLRVAGEGIERAALERQVRRLRLESRVEFLGMVADVAGIYAEADIFVMPSSYECFPLALAEALGAGLPAIGFADCPGTNDLIEDDVNGLLVEGEDRAAALAAGLQKLMASADLRSRLGAAGPRSLERFSSTAVADRWEDLLFSLSGGRSRAA